MPAVTWYFDFVSPYAYLQSTRLCRLPESETLEIRPVLFAGLLAHWDTKGPAEVPPKKAFTYRQVAWRAKRDGIPYRLPRHHPFNPLRALRLVIARANDRQTAQTLFRQIWVDGLLPDDDEDWRRMTAELGFKNADQEIAAPSVKAELTENGRNAIAAGVFGVPTFTADGHLFWGDDALDFVLDWLGDPELLDDDSMRRLPLPSPAVTRR